MAAFQTVRSRAGTCPPVRPTAAWQRDRSGRLVCTWTQSAASDDADDPLC